MNYTNLKKQIEHNTYPDPKAMQGNLDYALDRKKITVSQHEELTLLLEKKEEEKYEK